MAEENSCSQDIEKILSEHKKQKKELQAKIQSIKKSVPKGDKARMKETRKLIETMENELKCKQEEEINSLKVDAETPIENSLKSDSSAVSVNSNLEQLTITNREPKLSRAQKKREKKNAKAREQSAKLAEANEDYLKSARYMEEKQIKEKLRQLDLVIKPIQPDGNCMYSAIQDQLDSVTNDNYTVEDLRCQTASYMRSHRDDFLPFLTNQTTGDMFTHDEFEDYCAEIEKPSTWGGQFELLALTHILKSPIHVIQATTPVTIHGEEYEKEPIILTFHRHELGLGEHYNSVTQAKAKEEDSFDSSIP